MSGRDPIVVEAVRNGVVESVSLLDAVVADERGHIRFDAGDPERIAYVRSSLKPIQAAVCIEQGWQPGASEHVAIACASHNAEPAHLDAVRRLLASAGLDEGALRGPVAYPLLESEAARAGAPTRIMRDCSGKHAAFLATAAARGWPLETYLEPDHPIQVAVIERAKTLLGRIEAVGVDGCGAPTPAAPLRAIAVAFGRALHEAPDVRTAMNAHPFLVAGTDRIDTAVMRVAGDLTMKSGAEGIVCFASRSSGLSGAVKARDGGRRAVPPAALAVLALMGLVRSGIPDLAAFESPPVLGGGRPAGLLRVRLPGP